MLAQLADEIRTLVRESGYQAQGRRLGHGVLSASTQETREKQLIAIFREILDLGFSLPSVQALRDKHVRAVVTSWDKGGLAAATIQNRLTHLRKLCEWIGKAGMVRPAVEYIEDPERVRVGTVAAYDHAWRARGVDAESMIGLVQQADPYVGLQLKLCQVFMLRRREAIMLRPHIADRQTHIVVEEGAKGGRVRTIEILTAQQRMVLDEAKEFVKSKTGHMGHPGKTLKQNIQHFAYMVRRFGLSKDQLGVTPHGLRHEGLGDLFERIAEIPAPIRADNVREAISKADPEKLREARAKVSEVAGHSRLSISGAYIGGLMGRDRVESYNKQREQQNFGRFLDLRGKANRTEQEQLELNVLQRHLVKTLGVNVIFQDGDDE